MTKRAVITLGDRLKSARIKLKKSQLEVAVAAGIRPEVVSRLENGRTNASLATLHKVAPVLGLTIEDLVKAGPGPAVVKAPAPVKTKGKKVT